MDIPAGVPTPAPPDSTAPRPQQAASVSNPGGGRRPEPDQGGAADDRTEPSPGRGRKPQGEVGNCRGARWQGGSRRSEVAAESKKTKRRAKCELPPGPRQKAPLHQLSRPAPLFDLAAENVIICVKVSGLTPEVCFVAGP
uniref:Uncharacterized protein n=1 Tax=Sphaerodactylus townsendi TaxID=933632 RepID=A0ACB8FQ79_9SAUR